MAGDVFRIGLKCWRDIRDGFWVSAVLGLAFGGALLVAHPGTGTAGEGGLAGGVAGVWAAGAAVLFTSSAILLSAVGTPAELSGTVTPPMLAFPVSRTRWFAVHTAALVALLWILAAAVSLAVAGAGHVLGLAAFPREIAVAFPLLAAAVVSGVGLTVGILGWTGEARRAPLWAMGILVLLITVTLAGPLEGWSPLRVVVTASAGGEGVPWRPYLFLVLVGSGSFAAALAAPSAREG